MPLLEGCVSKIWGLGYTESIFLITKQSSLLWKENGLLYEHGNQWALNKLKEVKIFRCKTASRQSCD